MHIRPLGNRVLVKLIEPEQRASSGGIVLPDTAREEKALRGEVLAVGSAEKIEVKKGDIVLVPRFGGTQFEQDNEKLLIVKAADVLAVVKKK